MINRNTDWQNPILSLVSQLFHEYFITPIKFAKSLTKIYIWNGWNATNWRVSRKFFAHTFVKVCFIWFFVCCFFFGIVLVVLFVNFANEKLTKKTMIKCPLLFYIICYVIVTTIHILHACEHMCALSHAFFIMYVFYPINSERIDMYRPELFLSLSLKYKCAVFGDRINLNVRMRTYLFTFMGWRACVRA